MSAADDARFAARLREAAVEREALLMRLENEQNRPTPDERAVEDEWRADLAKLFALIATTVSNHRRHLRIVHTDRDTA